MGFDINTRLLMLFIAILLILILPTGCSEKDPQVLIPREQALPSDAVKITPETDIYPPILNSDEFETPVPLSTGVNTAGAEDSPFIPYGSDEMFFFWTPDVRIPAEKQVIDNVTGIYLSQRVNGEWQPAARVMLQDPGKLALDGCEFVGKETIYFCTAREGLTGIHWFSAQRIGDIWDNWKSADAFFRKDEWETGELHIWKDELYFHSGRAGGKGGYDIWTARMKDGSWSDLQNIEAVNTASNDGWPYITADGSELWFNRDDRGYPSLYRSKRVNGGWQAPELIVSQFAGEPTMDSEGNLYFVHHYFKDSKMLEADIYIAKKK
ncbi:MAG TPA: hypothetical protein VJI75_00240 [Candidatus Nanoarchaeia archaeon]|nr:hypothetical protein [Candidatus Nanoarchaeia archaeon]